MNKSHFKFLNSANCPWLVTACAFFMLVTICMFTLQDCQNNSPTQTVSAQQDQSPIEAILIEDEIQKYESKWISDPINENAAYNINLLKQQQANIRQQALQHLVTGIDELFNGRAYITSSSFAAVRKSPYVQNLADNILTNPLSTYEKEASNIATAANITGLCPSCGDTELMDCTHPTAWKLFGHIPCEKCDGDGVIRHSAKYFRDTGKASTICTDCTGRGTTPCPTCNGKQFIHCNVCHFDLISRYDEQTIQALQKLRQIANHLLLGGGDLYSPHAFEPAP